MLIVGLTGSIGMGKSTIAGRFRDLGVGVCDADAIVHGLYEGTALAPIESAFPGTTVDGKVDRQKLSQALLADPSGFKTLEAIVHPLVFAEEKAFLKQHADRGDPCAVLEIPLLFETGGDARVDVTVVVSAPADVQRQRVLERPGMTEEKFAEILSRQVPDEEKRRRADFIVDTGQEVTLSFAEVDAIVAALKLRKGTAYRTHWS
ncbi:MAG: dephospho-CoA kinase [Hyphomicrobiaceae bacterium]